MINLKNPLLAFTKLQNDFFFVHLKCQMQIIRYGSVFLYVPWFFSFIMINFNRISTWMKHFSNAIVVGQGLIISCNKRHADGLYLPQVFLPFLFKAQIYMYVYNYICMCHHQGFWRTRNIYVQKSDNMTYIFRGKTHRSTLLLFCQCDMWYHMELSSIKSLKK